LTCNGDKQTFLGLISGVFTTFFCPRISDYYLGHFFGSKIFCPYYPTHIESNKTLCSQAASQGREQWPLNPPKFSNYIFHPGSFPKLVSYFHMTLSCQRHGLWVQMGIYSRYVQEQFLGLFLKSH